ncbi:MAG: glycosyltransferase [Proteobacteria bacterium]|nr:glycosyltransferase [Pseudomonadota bacterium]
MPESLPLDVIVAIPTFRRPKMLERLLLALERVQTKASVRVLVADNDGERHEGFDLSLRLIQRGYAWPLETFVAHDRGIAQVRNALVERAMTKPFDFLAMLDDDEWPQPQWLEQFLHVQKETGAGALHGAVLRVYETTPGFLARQCDGVCHQRGTTGPIDMVESTGNVLIARKCIEELPQPWFDNAFALTGGEDRDFFVRLKARGCAFAWADEALVHAYVPASRANLKWALTRAYRVGNSDMRVFLKQRPKLLARAVEFAKIGGAILLFPILFVTFSALPNRTVEPLRKLCRAAGKIAAMFGNYYNEYSVTHGA